MNAKNIHLYTTERNKYRRARKCQCSKEVTVKNYTGKTHTVRRYSYWHVVRSKRKNIAGLNKQVSLGLGNRDVVGRFFMEHLEIKSELRLERPLPMKLYNLDGTTKTRAELAITEQQTEHRILNGTKPDHHANCKEDCARIDIGNDKIRVR